MDTNIICRSLAKLLLLGLSIDVLGAQSRIAVLLKNAANIPSSELFATKSAATRIFHRAGIEIEWVDCPSTSGEAVPRSSSGINDLPLFTVIVRVGGGPSPSHNMSLGFALPCAGMRDHAAVLSQPIAQIVHDHPKIIDGGALMGAAVAHELGHLLLGTTQHGSGIMKAN